MEQSRFDEIQDALASTRELLSDDTRTAHAIDRNDSWEEIADAIRRDMTSGIEGLDDLLQLCVDAAEEWREEA